MRGSNSHNTTRLLSTAGTFGELQIVAAPDRVIIDASTRTYDTLGHLHCEHALADLPLSAAVRLRDLLSEAIDHAASVTLDTRQSALWSDSAIRAQAERFGRRRVA
jgi:hypothetical protein